MATSQYIGARYVPVLADPIEWSNAKTYEPLTIVTHEGNSYTSRQFVPKDIDITNEAYWALTGNYNAQIEQYRRETAQAVEYAQELTNNAVTQVDEWLTDAQGKYGAKPFAFDTVADMQASYELLYVGAICHTNGFHASGDGGAAWYIISDTGNANSMDVLACGNLFAHLVIDEFVTPEMFGARGDSTNDDYAAIQRALNLFGNGGVIQFSNKKYVISNTLKVPNFTTLMGYSATPISKSPYVTFLDDIGTVIYLQNNANCNMLEPYDIENTLGLTIKNIVFYGNKNNQRSTCIGIYFRGGQTPVRSGSLFENVIVSWCNGDGFVFDKNQSAIKFNNVWSMRNNGNGIVMNSDDLQGTRWGAGNNEQCGLLCDSGRGSIRSYDCDFFGNGIGVYIKNTPYMKFYNLISQNNDKEGLIFESPRVGANGRIDIIGGFIGHNSIERSEEYSDVKFTGEVTAFPVNFTNVIIGFTGTSPKPKYAVEFDSTLSNILAVTFTSCTFYRNNTANQLLTNQPAHLNMINCTDITTAKIMPYTLPYEIDTKPFNRQIMYNSASKKINIYNGSHWIDDTVQNYTYISGSTAVTENSQFILCGGNTDIQITLPDNMPTGKTFHFAKLLAAGSVTFVSNTYNVRGKSTITGESEHVMCIFTGTGWYCC